MDLKEKVKEFFKKNPKAERCYSTSDENIFAAEHYATNWARSLKDDKVETHLKSAESEKPKAESGATDETGKAKGGKQKAEDTTGEDKAALVKRYIELFGTKPSNLLGVEKLKAKIAEKEAEGEKKDELVPPVFPADRVEEGQSSDEIKK